MDISVYILIFKLIATFLALLESLKFAILGDFEMKKVCMR
jgi:hypothetical protein